MGILHAKEMHEQRERCSYLYGHFMVRVRNSGSAVSLGW